MQKPSCATGLIFLVLGLLVNFTHISAAPKKGKKAGGGAVTIVEGLYKKHFANEQNFHKTFRQCRALFSPAIQSLMDAVDAKQAKRPDDLVGLDFDPIVDAQDNAQGYEVGKATPDGKGVLVPVKTRFGKSHRLVRYRLKPSNGSYIISDILYQEAELVSLLTNLKNAK